MLHSMNVSFVTYMSTLACDLYLTSFTKNYEVPKHHTGEPLASWYRRFVVHVASKGVFIPPYEPLSTTSV